MMKTPLEVNLFIQLESQIQHMTPTREEQNIRLVLMLPAIIISGAELMHNQAMEILSFL